MSFDQTSNILKRQRLVTQSDALLAQFNAVVKLDEEKKLGVQKIQPIEETKGGFALGAVKPNVASKKV